MTSLVSTASKNLIPTSNGSTRVINLHALVSSEIMLDLKEKCFQKMRNFEISLKPSFGKSFRLNPDWNKQKENDYLLTDVFFFFHAIICEAQSNVCYVTHALPFKVWTNSVFMLFDRMLFKDLEIQTSFCFSSSTAENFEYASLYLSWMRFDLRQKLENSNKTCQKTLVWDVSKNSESEELRHPTCIHQNPMSTLLVNSWQSNCY